MAEHGGGLQARLTDAASQLDEHQDHGTMTSAGDARSDDLSLEEILGFYSQPINEEQAWAVCYQCCVTLVKEQRGRRCSDAAEPAPTARGRISGPGDVYIAKDGSVELHKPNCEGKYNLSTQTEMIESLGIMIYKALDYGLKESEERELSPPLEQLIDMMINIAEAERDICPDEGYDATEEENDDPDNNSSVHSYRAIFKLCTDHLPSQSDAPSHYQAVCRALYTETRELRTFLDKIKSAKENLRKMEEESGDPRRDLNELQSGDWARFWVQVMRDLREGVKLKKVQERQYDPLPTEYQLTPYEMLMDDIRSKRYKLRKVMVNGDIPPRLKKSAHEVILEFIRSRPPLNPVSARKLKPPTQPPPTLHERILEEIKSERKLRPVTPDIVRRGRLGFGKTRSMPQDLFRTGLDEFSPYMGRRTSSTLSLTIEPASPKAESSGSQSVPQRKKLLKAPSLAELDTSDSDEEFLGNRSASTSSVATSLMDDTSPESALGKNTPPQFLPISSTPQPERRQTSQRRHSIEKETPTNVQPFQPPSKLNSKSLEEFCFPVECLSLTVEEVMHIRQVLVKAELEKFQQYKEVYTAMKKGKLCFCCRTKRFSFFTWSYICQFCKKPVCSQCCKKMRLPSKPYSSLPIYSMGSTNTLPRERIRGTTSVGQGVPVAEGRLTLAVDGASAATTSKSGAKKTGKAAGGVKSDKSASGHRRPSIHKTMSKLSKHASLKSHEPLELPSELTEDWATMEVCVDCKKFISDIIASSKHSLSLATKRARLKCKTQSLYMSSPKGREEYRPSERTISEI
ncbi:protein spire homolog 1 isoform X2 [Syngnathoides biaculeatus]|uniref:protein spire homolog 1 isoform X2 n=1 Tax=Syngnathoides biaculeatus TaxID=300417 RepID=UPI002ADDBC2C|nr:protein spire homolog 1 isoform X2 [Syngnathoides biaculeatus]